MMNDFVYRGTLREYDFEITAKTRSKVEELLKRQIGIWWEGESKETMDRVYRRHAWIDTLEYCDE